jgi:gamma-glutamylcyclotransferase (GGCT)/AIG2-like uncharacterized protein YtfP
MTPTDPLRVFVYGTLKPGETYYESYCAGRVRETQVAIAYGQLYALPLGYPAMTEGSDPIQGFLFSLMDAHALADLDELEDYSPDRPAADNEYSRRCIEVFSPDGQSLGTAWGYFMTPEQVQCLGGVVVPHGYWTAQATYFNK